MARLLSVGVVGTGHLGTRHAQTYARLKGVKLAAVCDTNIFKARKLARKLRCQAFADFRQMISQVEAVSLAVPTSAHYDLGCKLLNAGIHTLIEKPLALTLSQADGLIRIARKKRRLLQVGHIERFNSAIQAAAKHLTHPRFIDVDRLSPYPFRGTDVSVVLDVMIHDLDMLLALVRSKITRIDALGISVLSKSEDIANARVQFASGCVAQLTASRVSPEPIRRIRVFQENSYLSIDYQAQTVELAHRTRRGIHRVALPVNRKPPLEKELEAFINSIRHKQPAIVTGKDGRAALAFALRIEHSIHRHNRRHRS